jgi:hypothetical protein
VRISEWREVEVIHGDLSQYRVRSVSLLRKYFKMSVELGHLPSLLGKEFFRTQVTSYTTHTFEDAVIFVHDMERALESIAPGSQLLIARVFFQEYSHEEAAQMLGIPIRSFGRSLADALDSLSELMLARGLMEHSPAPISASQVKELNRLESPPKMPPVSVRFLMSLRNPKFCQARKIAKSRVSF